VKPPAVKCERRVEERAFSFLMFLEDIQKEKAVVIHCILIKYAS
jgi:hypothetical protein